MRFQVSETSVLDNENGRGKIAASLIGTDHLNGSPKSTSSSLNLKCSLKTYQTIRVGACAIASVNKASALNILRCEISKRTYL